MLIGYILDVILVKFKISIEVLNVIVIKENMKKLEILKVLVLLKILE